MGESCIVVLFAFLTKMLGYIAVFFSETEIHLKRLNECCVVCNRLIVCICLHTLSHIIVCLNLTLSYYSLTDQHAGIPMGITAENLAEKYGISREVCYIVTLESMIASFRIIIVSESYASHALIYLFDINKHKTMVCTKDCDNFAIRSQQTWGEAHKNGVFDLEIAPVDIESKKGTKVWSTHSLNLPSMK